MARFTATHGVTFTDAGIQFELDREATGTGQAKVYAAELDAKQTAALKKFPAEVLAEYGIEQAKGTPAAGEKGE